MYVDDSSTLSRYTLKDLGTEIQEYQSNGEINGVGISLGDLGSLIQYYQNG